MFSSYHREETIKGNQVDMLKTFKNTQLNVFDVR